jgi:hypothetical protein
MYQPYPAPGLAQESPRIQPPRPVLHAVKLMYAGAALSSRLTVPSYGGWSARRGHPDHRAASMAPRARSEHAHLQ